MEMPDGPRGARGRQRAQMGGWVAFTQADKEAESAARDATLGAARSRPSMLALKYMRPCLRAHQIR